MALHLVVEPERELPLACERAELPEHRAEGTVRDRLRGHGVLDALRFEREAQPPMQRCSTFELHRRPVQGLLHRPAEPVVMVAGELLEIVGIGAGTLRKPHRAHGDLVPEFRIGAHVGKPRHLRGRPVAFRIAEPKPPPELLESILRRQEEDFFPGRGIEQQVAARLVDAREVKEGRFLDELVPGLHVGLLRTRLRRDTCDHAERIEGIKHRLAALFVQIFGIIARGIDKNLRIRPGMSFCCHIFL